MRKMTPMILVILMLASVLSSIDVYELQEQNEFEETSARAGADAEVVYVTSPRETLMAGDEVTNQLLAGEPVNFKAYLRNGGDADLTNMQYQVTVYDSVNGERSDIATDSNGNNLAWSNDNAVCATSCQNTVLTPGEFIDGGESTLTTSAGNVIVWTPTAGEYFVEVKVTSLFAGDPGNDEISYPVSVKDYYDIVLDMHWLDANGDSVDGAVEGVDPTSFKVTLSIAGTMDDVNIRNATIEFTMDGGTVSDSNYLTEILGEQRNVEISDDGQGNKLTGDRMMIGADASTGVPIVGETTLTFEPPTDDTETVYSVSASLKSYTVYGTEGCSSSGESCERLISGSEAEDEFKGNNIASVSGSGSIVHDITLGDFFLMSIPNDADQEDEEGGTNAESYGSIGEEITETLSTGTYKLVALVEHSSTSSLTIYDWSVTFTVTDSTGTSSNFDALDCNIAEYAYESYKYLGLATETTDAEPNAVACTEVTMVAGEYNVMAEVNMLGLYDEVEGEVNTKVVDMVDINNKADYDVSVDNFAPTIISLKGATSVLVGESIGIIGNAFDVEGDELTFSWFDSSGNPIQCTGDSSTGQCGFVADISMVPSYQVRMVVDDGYNSVDSTVTVEVLVSETFTATGLADGFASVYSITAKTSGLTVSFTDGPLDEVNTDACANAATPVGAVTVNPSTTYDSSVLMSQSITVHFPSNLGVKYMWMESGVAVINVASGDGDVVDASTSGYTYNFPAGSDMIPPGTNFYLIADECETADPPSGSITQLTATPAMGGDIVINYNYDTLLSDETVRISVTTSSGSTPEISYDRVESDTRSITWSSGTDGQEYTVSAQLCNQYSCGSASTATATSDASVASVTATSITIAESGENWDVAWQASAVDDDVAGWYVCYNKGEFTATEMKTLIDSGACKMVMSGTQTSIAKYTTIETTQVHFGIVPHDAVMNIAYGPSTDSILYDRAQDTTNPDDGTTKTDSEASSGVPTWTWGVIGAVVVVAFIVGAFILSRGDGEGDDDKEWDY